MSLFPTKILLATEGSEEAASAARTAADLAQKTASELHVVLVELSLQSSKSQPVSSPTGLQRYKPLPVSA